MTTVLAILEAGDRYPSGTVRALIYRDLFARDGFDVEFVSRQPLSVVDAVAKVPWLPGTARLVDVATRWSERRLAARAAHHDVIYLSKVLSPRFLRRVRTYTRGRLVLDFGDAVWLDGNYGQGAGARFREAVQLVDAVTTDNEYTAAYVRKLGRACTVVPDSPQLEAFDRRRSRRPVGDRVGDRVVVGWVGSPSTLYNLDLIAGALETVARRHPSMQLRFVGVGSDAHKLRRFAHLSPSIRPSYNQTEMIDEILEMDIGLFPLQDIEQSWVRGILKATVYMAGETAVVASPVGQVPEVIRDGVTGFLATTRDAWIEKLDALITDAALRRRLAAAGLEFVRARFGTDQSWSLLRGVLRGELESRS